MSNPVKPTSDQARDAVNIFASLDVLGILSDKNYPGQTNKTIETVIKEYFVNNATVKANIPQETLNFAKTQPLQNWNGNSGRYIFNGVWDSIVAAAEGQFPKFASTAGTRELLAKYVRLIAGRGDTQGWKLAVDSSDLVKDGNATYLTEAYNLSVKAYPGQWLRWWGNSI